METPFGRRPRPPALEEALRSEASQRREALNRQKPTNEPQKPRTTPQIQPIDTTAFRQHWQQHGTGLSQALEDKRSNVQVTHAEPRVDPGGRAYTAYIIRVGDRTTERRYSDFERLHRRFPHISSTEFPSKHWAGRLGHWTPSRTFAPDQCDALIQYRVKQLDVWLVHLMAAAQHHTEDDQRALDDFLSSDSMVPCQRSNADGPTSPNPLSCSLGATLRQAAQTIAELTQDQMGQSIPVDLLQHARGLCILTVGKAGWVVSARLGTGVVVARLGTGWSAPVAVGTYGVGWGALVGADLTRYCIVLTTDRAVEAMVASSSVQLGAELDVAVGPVGRAGRSDLQSGDWTLHQAYTYAHSQGFFVGASLEGSVIQVRDEVNAKFYGRRCYPLDLLQSPGPKAAEPLYQALNDAMRIELRDGAIRPSELFGIGG